MPEDQDLQEIQELQAILREDSSNFQARRRLAVLWLDKGFNEDSLKQFQFSPLYWLYRFKVRKCIRKTVALSDKVFTISQLQCNEYSREFNTCCSVLYKGGDFSREPPEYNVSHPIKLCYTGNLSAGRWKTIIEIARALDVINKNKINATFNIYSITPLTERQIKMIERDNYVKFRGAVSGLEAQKIQSKSDILIHCESFDIKEKYKVRLSFSTKIVDYFLKKKCIFAVGDKNSALMKYLIENKAAICACDRETIYNVLYDLINSPNTLIQYADNAWNCGKKNHNILDIQKNILTVFKNVINKYNENITN